MKKILDWFYQVKDNVAGWGLLFIAVIVISGIYLYNQNQDKQQKIKQEQIDKNSELIDSKNNEYRQKMNPICSSKVTEISGLDFYRCESIKFDTNVEWKEYLKNPDLPSFCQRKIQELTANEFIDCLEEKTSP